MSKNTIQLIICCFLTIIFSNSLEAQSVKKVWNNVKKEVKKVTKKKKITENEKNKSDGEKINRNQEKEENTTDLDFGETFLFKSPKINFISFEIQKHKGLPRFGAINLYGLKNVKYRNNLSSNERLQLNNRIKLETSYNRIYFNLVEMKFMKSLYNEMDKKYITQGYKKRNSLITQDHLRNLAFNLSSTLTKNQFFCNSDKGDCNQDDYSKRYKRESGGWYTIKSGISKSWGGNGADKFSQQRKYSEFVEKHFLSLQNWSNTFWKGNEQQAYLVLPITSGVKTSEYDFEKGGYWIRLDLGLRSTPSSSDNLSSKTYFSNYKAVNKFEMNRLSLYKKAVSERKNPQSDLIFKMPAEQAEKLTKNNRGILSGYAVYKVKISFKKLKEDNKYSSGLYGTSLSGPRNISYIEYNFNIESPIVELYSDESLKNKFGQISLE